MTPEEEKAIFNLKRIPQNPSDYLVVRVELTHVYRGIMGIREKVIGARTVIEPSSANAIELASKVFSYIDVEKKSTETVEA